MTIPSSEEAEREEVVIEEAWTNEDGNNIFDLTFENNMVRTTMKNLFPNSDRCLLFDSYSTEQMTPLDMLYETSNIPQGTADDDKHGDANFKLDEFYDGTGSLVWLACIALCHLVAHDLVSPLRAHDDDRRLFGGKDGSKPATKEEVLTICELGCGTGLASIATLVASAVRKEMSGEPLDRKVVFTDNDPEALELAKENCQLNQLDPKSYGHQLLSWGVFPDPAEPECENGNLKGSSVDVVLAADVIYDISMIPPLLQTSAWLLKADGSLVVSHVPRFCLPKDEREQEEAEKLGEESSPQEELEAHIIEQAALVGLHLRETILPHEALANIIEKDLRGDPSTGINEEVSAGQECQISCSRLEQAHAVLFVFTLDTNAHS